MKDGFLHALRRCAETGEPPIPEPRAAREQPMGEIHEQLLASLQERGDATAASPVRTVPIVNPGPASLGGIPRGTPPGPGQGPLPVAQARDAAARFQRDAYQDRLPGDLRDPAVRASRASRKGTIEDALGEPPAQEAQHGAIPPVADRPDPRATDDSGPLDPLPLQLGHAAAVAGGDHGGVGDRRPAAVGEVRATVAADPRTETCTTCRGRGFLTFGSRTTHCGACGGEGRVRPKLFVLPAPIEEKLRAETAEAVERALAKEAAGVQPLPLDYHDVEAPWHQSHDSVAEQEVPHADVAPEGAQADGLNPQGAPAPLSEEDVLIAVDAYDDSEEGPIRFPGSIAESNQGPDPRYRSWMGRCLGLAATRAADPEYHVAPTTPLSYDLPTEVDLLPPFCFICGPAGTGKTFWAKALAAGDRDGVILAATTGIAAVNLGEGTTINALLKFYNTASLMEAFTGGWLEAQLKKLRGAGLRRIVLDEVSMLDGDQLTILSRALDNVNQDRHEDDAELGLILVGDFAQLPPVKAPFAFESAEWGRYAQATYGLSTIRRQADQDFVQALQAVRRGDHRAALAFFGDRLEQMTAPAFHGTTILAKNEAVGKFNGLMLDKITGNTVDFPSTRWGKLRAEWGGPPKPEHEWGIPEKWRTKIGALVMILANRNMADPGEPPSYLYVNGDLGTVVDADRGTLHVRLQRTGEVVGVQPILRENVIPLEPGRRKVLRAEGHPERITANGRSEVIGAVHYMPARHAWASTCHKSQGLSLDAVQLNLRDPFWRTGGMLYVGLSRARTAEGLRIVGNVEGFRARCTVDPRVVPWL
jgi:hypothetical protein